MSLSDLVGKMRGICKCNEQAKQVAARQSDQHGEEAEAMTSPLPAGVARAIDVSQLPPPLPMVRILETLRDLGPSQTLLVHHTRRPIHLYPRLDALNCAHETIEVEPGKIEVRITTPAARRS